MTVVNLQGFCGLGYRLHLTLRILKCCATFKATLYSAALGLAIAQACYATGENHERAVL